MHRADRDALRTLRLLRTYARVAKPLLAERIAANGCIAMTRVTLDVLAHYGIAARPHVCEAMLFSPGWVHLWKRLGRFPTHDEMQAETAHDVWSVGVGSGQTPEETTSGWDAHLVAVTERCALDHMLIDASLDQGARPQYRIEVPPIVVTAASEAFLGGDAAEIILPQRMAGLTAYVAYRTRRDWPPYADAPDWCEPGRYLSLTHRIIDRLNKEVTPWAYSSPSPQAGA